MDKPVNCSINQAITPLSDKTNCHENALIVKLVQKGAKIANRNRGRHFSLTQKTIKYANGHATKPAITVENKDDVKKYKVYENISEIILFDSKGYEKSMSFDHDLLNEVEDGIEKMIAGNIQIEDISNFKNKNFIIDLSGSLEDTNGKKDINKIDKLLNLFANI